jgi:hypothetical protein
MVGRLGAEPEVQAEFARHLCVLASGFIEKAVSEIFTDYARRNSSPAVARYVAARMDNVQNMKCGKLLELVGEFSPEWRASLEDYVEGERKDAVDSIVSNRHQIAHGESVGITYHQISRYYEKAAEVVDFLQVTTA